MPGGDRTGPMGEGPMTGRTMGNCVRNDFSGDYNRPRRFFRGNGRGLGCGWRYSRRLRNVSQPSQSEQIDMLKRESEYLKESLQDIENRIHELSEQD